MPARICKMNPVSQNNRIGLTLMDLVAIFMDESNAICRDKSIAKKIALESLRDYIKKMSAT